MNISNKVAQEIFRIAEAAGDCYIDRTWSAKVEKFSLLCAECNSLTHVAFLGTAMLAKAVDENVDLKAIKPKHAGDNKRSYSARTLCHEVLVPLSAELGVSLGVNGREPLNNQPYFRMTSLGDGTPVRDKARPAFEYMLSLVDELQGCTIDKAKSALAAFIQVRKRHQIVYPVNEDLVSIPWSHLADTIQVFVQENSEGGRRAQAAVAGLLDVCAGPYQVESGKINDPSRHYPGDVAVRNTYGEWSKAFEVRDKCVTDADVYIFARSCLNKLIGEAAFVLVDGQQQRLDDTKLREWAASVKIGITLFYGWDTFVDQVLFWAEAPKPEAVQTAVQRIEARLVAIGASASSLDRWHALTRMGA